MCLFQMNAMKSEISYLLDINGCIQAQVKKKRTQAKVPKLLNNTRSTVYDVATCAAAAEVIIMKDLWRHFPLFFAPSTLQRAKTE